MKKLSFITLLLLICNVQIVFATSDEYEENFDGNVQVQFRLQVGSIPEEEEEEQDDSNSNDDNDDSGGSGGGSGGGSTGGTPNPGGSMPYPDDMFYGYQKEEYTSSDTSNQNQTQGTVAPQDDLSENPQTGSSTRQLIQALAMGLMGVTGSLLVYEFIKSKK